MHSLCKVVRHAILVFVDIPNSKQCSLRLGLHCHHRFLEETKCSEKPDIEFHQFGFSFPTATKTLGRTDYIYWGVRVTSLLTVPFYFVNNASFDEKMRDKMHVWWTIMQTITEESNVFVSQTNACWRGKNHCFSQTGAWFHKKQHFPKGCFSLNSQSKISSSKIVKKRSQQ